MLFLQSLLVIVVYNVKTLFTVHICLYLYEATVQITVSFASGHDSLVKWLGLGRSAVVYFFYDLHFLSIVTFFIQYLHFFAVS